VLAILHSYAVTNANDDGPPKDGGGDAKRAANTCSKNSTTSA